MIVQATTDHILQAAMLFNLCRQFFKQPADPALAESFIRQRIVNNESIIFLAFNKGEPVGIAQLYPSFCSIKAVKTLILGDLYVKEEFRGQGIGQSLISKAKQYAKASGAKQIELSIATNNKAGLALYNTVDCDHSTNDMIRYSLNI